MWDKIVSDLAVWVAIAPVSKKLAVKFNLAYDVTGNTAEMMKKVRRKKYPTMVEHNNLYDWIFFS